MCEGGIIVAYPSSSSREGRNKSTVFYGVMRHFALSHTPSNIDSVSRPVKVFCWLG